ncbi:hypothetical protein CN184_25110 [Sinorhizobium medicae]|uniref:hypothetical protein n=1 Tax=Sinorhizobium medicae TaxID=110321 RepID=UPI000FD5E091|nr:hypothetical protein [Sinorhizobium medicae]MQX50987.1 hypothetical protein [Sinorhizobium medicae]RVJ17812.1 hypothetical protein CN184_25110 [Sinorhizobium medicae]
MAVEWTITIEGKNEFGDICRKEVRIDKSWESLFDGDLGLSIEDGKIIVSVRSWGRLCDCDDKNDDHKHPRDQTDPSCHRSLADQ